MAEAQAPAHEAKLTEYEALLESAGGEIPEGARISLDAGIEAERIWVGFWSRLRGRTR